MSNRIAIKYGSLKSATTGIKQILTREIPDMERELIAAQGQAVQLTFASVTLVPPAQTEVDINEAELTSLSKRINTLMETTQEWDSETTALMQGLMMNLPIELDANGNPKVIDWSSMVNALGARNLDRMYETLRNPDGSYNWDIITVLLGSDVGDLTPVQLDALARVYMRIDAPDDLNRFITALARMIGRGHDMTTIESEFGVSAHRPLDTIWRFDSGMTNAIRDRVELQIDYLLEREWGKSKTAGQERLRLLQHSALLYVTANLTATRFEDTERLRLWNDRPEWNLTNPQVSGVVFGTADSPGLTIGRNEDGSLVLNFAHLDMRLNMDNDPTEHIRTMPMPDHPHDRKHLNNFRLREINISTAYGLGECGGEFGQAIRDRSRGSALSNHEHNWGESFFNAVVSTGVSFIPVVGDTVGVATGTTGPLGRAAQISQIRDDINRVGDAADLAAAAERGGLNGVFISENGAFTPPQMWFSPTRLEQVPHDVLPTGKPWGQ